MLASHWMKAAFVFLHLAAVAFALSHCGRPVGTTPPPVENTGKEMGLSPVWERAAERQKERTAHTLKRAKDRADHEKLEAELRTIAKIHIPAALDEFAEAASAYRRKVPDLARLKKEEQWEREAPVKEALVRARALTADYYTADREAQKGREGPTLHAAEDADALAKRIDGFKKGGDDFGAFAKQLPPYYGKVSEDLLLKAIEAIARAALPADAFDPCARDASACPKPAPPPTPPPPKTLPPTEPPPPAPMVVASSGYCVTSAPTHGIGLLAHPQMSAPLLLRLSPGQCGITPTGRRARPYSTYRTATLLEVEVNGKTGWVREGTIGPGSSNGFGPAGNLTVPDQRYCVNGWRFGGQSLPLLTRPNPRAPTIVEILPTSCRLTATGRESRNGAWLEVMHDYGYAGWVRRGDLRSYR